MESSNLTWTDHWRPQIRNTGVLTVRMQQHCNFLSTVYHEVHERIYAVVYSRETIVQISTLTAERDHASPNHPCLFAACRRRADRALIRDHPCGWSRERGGFSLSDVKHATSIGRITCAAGLECAAELCSHLPVPCAHEEWRSCASHANGGGIMAVAGGLDLQPL